MMYHAIQYLLIVLPIIASLVGCKTLSGRVPLEVDDSSAITAAKVTVGLGKNRNKSLAQDLQTDLELMRFSASGNSSQPIGLGSYIENGRNRLNGPGSFPQKWKTEKTDIAFRISRGISLGPPAKGMFHFSGLVGLSRIKQSVFYADEFNPIFYKKSFHAPLIGLAIGFQANKFISFNLESRYSSSLRSYEFTEHRVFINLTPVKYLELDIGYMSLDSTHDRENHSSVLMEATGPWLSLGVAL